jgi:hypothetical protein
MGALVATLRTPNLFPIEPYAAKIAESVMALYDSADNGSAELFFDDSDLVGLDQNAAWENPEIEADIEAEPSEIDTLFSASPSIEGEEAIRIQDDKDMQGG